MDLLVTNSARLDGDRLTVFVTGDTIVVALLQPTRIIDSPDLGLFISVVSQSKNLSLGWVHL
jgi:hypothetical protein